MKINYPTYNINTNNPDPTEAINAFLWKMAKARDLGMMPKTEHVMAEHLLRGEVKILYYSNSGGINCICLEDELFEEDDGFELIEFIYERRKRAIARRKAGSDTDGSPEGGDAKQAPGDSPTAGAEGIAQGGPHD